MQAVLDEETPPREAAQCACAWDKLEARKAVLQGRPANTSQSIRSDPVKKSKQPQAAPMEYIEPEPMRVGPAVHPTDTQPDRRQGEE